MTTIRMMAKTMMAIMMIMMTAITMPTMTGNVGDDNKYGAAMMAMMIMSDNDGDDDKGGASDDERTRTKRRRKLQMTDRDILRAGHVRQPLHLHIGFNRRMVKHLCASNAEASNKQARVQTPFKCSVPSGRNHAYIYIYTAKDMATHISIYRYVHVAIHI